MPDIPREIEQIGSHQRTNTTDLISYDLFPDKGIKNPTKNLLTEVFGYSEDSQTNTLALLQKVRRLPMPQPRV